MPNNQKLSPNKMFSGMPWKSRLILAAVCLTLIGAGFIVPTGISNAAKVSAQENSANNSSAAGQDPAIKDEQFARSAETERKFAELAAKARDGKSVRVIIGVKLPVAFRAEGLLKRQEDKETQHLLIAQAQDALLNRLQANTRESVKRFKYIPYLAMEVSASELEQLKAMPEVFQIQEDALAKPALNESTRLIGSDAAAASGFTGAGQTVAILDTGVDGTHPALSGKVVSEACFSHDGGSNQSLCPGAVTSSTAAGSGVNCTGVGGCDHGTHVAGIAAARPGTNSSGVTLTGVARDANIIAIQVFTRINSSTDCDGSAPCVRSFTSDQISGLERVRDLANMTDGGGNPLFHISSVNMSLGDDSNNSSNCDGDSRKSAIDNLRSLGIATVISAGNESHRAGIGVPACISSAISVGSTDKDDTVSGFSNNAAIVSILAPGGSIQSTLPGGVYGFKSGTSMAAPHVTGAWAVFKSAPGHGSDSVATVLTQFQNTGVPVTDARTPNPTNLVRPRLRLDSALGLRSADLQLSKTGSPGTVVAGTNLTYTIHLTNAGPDAASNVTVTDNLPANTSLVSGPVTVGWNCNSTNPIQCTKASVANGESATFTIVVKVDAATPNNSTLSNTATVITSDFDPNATNSTATATNHVIAQADLEVISKVDTPDPVVTNNPLQYTITLRNNGPSVATSVELSDPLPIGAIFNNCASTNGGICLGSSQNRTVSFASLGVGDMATVTFDTTANCSLADGTVINNTATISAATTDPNPANNSASASTVAQNPPPIIVCPVSRDVIAPTPGSTTAIVTYPDPVVVDNCPGVTVVCVPASGSAFPLGLTTVTCTATDSGGATASCSFTVTVWDASIQDDNSGDYLLFNTFTGEYKYVRCGVDGFTMIGQGEISRVGCVVTLHDDSRVNASFDRCTIAPRNTGNATIKRLQPDTTFVLKDRNILNNSPSCAMP
ncbi:MAG: S8 family serine peptidase [Acidobacteria bacterium]|nr:S8 family serine peptidase [Acidobacteriota bacterium]